MKTLILQKSPTGLFYKELISLSILICLFLSSNIWLRWLDNTAALLDPGITQLFLLAMISFLGFTALSHWLLQRWWQRWASYPYLLWYNNLTT